MEIDRTYQKILDEIEQGHRGLIRFNRQELQELNELLEKYQTTPDKLEKVLCIVEHSAAPYGGLESNLLRILNSPATSSQLIVFALNCARKHIVEARFQKGLRLDYTFLETLKKLLFHRDPEVVEWTLRLIEGCGNQGIYFRREFDKIKPPPWKWFNSHQRAVREIITLLERRWSPFEKSKT